MVNFYEILGITQSATSAQVRAAYKRLAMKYHPDHNPDNREAEEMFKKINEAYHILSDPLKKSRYDSQINPSTIDVEDYFREVNRRRYWYWHLAQQKRYKLDKEYFKIQGLAFLVFIVISGFCFGIIHTANYVVQQKHLERWRANSLSLKQVNALFISGKFEDAFNLISALKKQDPLEFRFNFARDSLVNELRHMAESKYNEKDFSQAVLYYLTIKTYEEPVRFETIRRIYLCQYYLGNFKESLQALKHLHNQRPNDLELVYQIGIINLEKLDNPVEAMQYFTLGKKLFKENLSAVYGAAFEVIMDPADAPDIYFDIFEARARTNLQLKNYKEAVTDCNWAIYLRPYRGEMFRMRAEVYQHLHRPEKVCNDLEEAKRLGVQVNEQLMKHCR